MRNWHALKKKPKIWLFESLVDLLELCHQTSPGGRANLGVKFGKRWKRQEVHKQNYISQC